MEFLSNYLKNPHWRRQHRWRKAIWNTFSRVGLTGIHALPLSRRWVEIHRQRMPLRNLPAEMEGFKLVQISDLHYSPVVWQRYLIQFVSWINELKPDLVVVTGDLITGGYRFAHRIATILSHIHARCGVICTFGNHDYSIYGKRVNGEGGRRADYLEKCLKARGLIVLRNQVWQLPANGESLTIVGLDDEWSGMIDPARAFAGIEASRADHLFKSQSSKCFGSDGLSVGMDAGRPHARAAGGDVAVWTNFLSAPVPALHARILCRERTAFVCESRVVVRAAGARLVQAGNHRVSADTGWVRRAQLTCASGRGGVRL